MKVKDIDLKHFTIQLERVGSLINSTVIRIRSKPEYVNNYKDSHGEPIKLSFTLQTNMHLRFTEKTKKVILSFLPTEEIYRLKDSIAYRLSNIIKERDIQLYGTQNELDVKEEITPKQTSDLNLQDDFDFEDTVLSKGFNKEETLVNTKHLNDEFDFDFDDVVTSDFEEILEKNTPVEARPINELIESLLSSKQQLDNNYKLFTIMANAAARFEQRSKSIELTVANLERELLNALQNKYK